MSDIKCTTCYPIAAQILEMKFEGEKGTKQCVMRAWKECDQTAVEHITDYVDTNKPNTIFVIHRCPQHVEEAKLQREANDKAAKGKAS